MDRRLLIKVLLSVPLFARAMQDIDVKGCKIKTDRLYYVNEDRMLFQWVKHEGHGIYSVGFMQVLSSLLYPLYSVKLKPVGTKLEPGDNLAVIETGKKVSTFPSPIGGTIVEINPALEKDPSPIISSPYSTWLVKIESDDRKSISSLKRAQEVVDVVRRVIIREGIECIPR